MIAPLTLLGLLAAGVAPASSELARYTPAAFASATLLVDPRTHSVSVLGESNVVVRIKPAEYQDLRISPAFYVECRLAPNAGLSSVGVWASKPNHLIPADIVAYHTFDPTYVELDIDMSYFENRLDEFTIRDHTVHIDFYTRP